jgi:hypothetical protein
MMMFVFDVFYDDCALMAAPMCFAVSCLEVTVMMWRLLEVPYKE